MESYYFGSSLPSHISMATLKLTYKRDTQVLPELPQSFGKLCVLTAVVFNVKDFSFKYIDEEGDEITVENQLEYNEVLRIKDRPLHLIVFERDASFVLQPRDSLRHFEHIASLPLIESQLCSSVVDADFAGIDLTQPIRLTEDIKASPSQAKDPQPIYQYIDPRDLRSSVKEIFQQQLAQMSASVAIERAVVFRQACSVCLVDPVTGVLYNCLICKGFYLCSSCEELCQHPHPLLKIRKLSQLEFLKAVDQRPNLPYPIDNKPPIAIAKPVPKPSAKVESSNKANIDRVIGTINEMGFFDREAILEALRINKFDVGEAVNYLLARS